MIKEKLIVTNLLIYVIKKKCGVGLLWDSSLARCHAVHSCTPFAVAWSWTSELSAGSTGI